MDDQPPRNAPPTLRMPTEHVPGGTPGTGRDGQPVTDLGSVVVTAGADGQDACDVCRSTGLAILPVRPAAVPSACADLGSLEPGRGCAEEIASSGFGYALRTLRQGMLYLFYESGPAGTDYWEAYAVASNGTLWKQATAASARLIVGGGQPACSREGHDATRMEFIVIPKPDQCGTVWLAFSQDKWTDATLERYASDSDLRAERMQPIEPAEWIGSPDQGADRAPVNAASDLKVVMEYATLDSVVGDHPDLPFQGPVQPISREDGSFDQRVLELNATRYRWSLRNQRLPADPEPDISLDTSYAALRGASRKGGSGQSAAFHTPMMLALWDPIGIIHELNGYRHDVLGHIVRYQQERGLETDAFEGFRQIDVLLQQHAGVMAGKLKDAGQERMREEIAVGDAYAMSGLYGDERALVAEHEASLSRYREGQVGWEDYQAERSRSIARHVGPGRRSEVEGRFRRHDRVRRLDTPGYWERSEDLASAITRQRATREWNEKYKPLFDDQAIDRFQQQFERLLEAASRLLEQRSHAVAQWLQNELFLAVLEDYDKADPASGVLFEEAMTAALDGLAVDRVGRTTLESLADNLSVTERSCVLWRVVAQNQEEACQELKQVLEEADSLKDLVMDAAGAGWNRFVAASGYLKKFLGLYKKFEDVQKEAVPSTSSNAALRATGIDRFVVATGAVLLNRFPLRHIDNSVGNFLVRHVLQVRAGMDAVESSNLITAHARATPEVNAYYAERVRHYRASPRLGHSAQFLALRDVESHRGVTVMRAQWQQAIAGVDNPVRLAGLTGVLELMNFVSILARADKTAKDYGALVASGLAMASTYASVSVAVNKELFAGTSRSYGNVKAVGSALGGVATMIGVVFDVKAGVESFEDGRRWLAFAYGTKILLGALAGGAQVLTAFAYSAPVVQRALGRGRTVTLLTNVRHGIEGADELRRAAAAGRGVAQGAVRQGALVGVGRGVLWLGGWQVAVGITAVQAMIWVLTPNALEEWCERNHFGRVREKNRLGFGGSKPKYRIREVQAEAFASAVNDVGIAPPEESENEEEEPA